MSKLKRSTTRNIITAVMTILPTKKSPGQEGFPAGFFQTINSVNSRPPQLFHKIERKRTLLNSIYETNNTLIPKPG